MRAGTRARSTPEPLRNGKRMTPTGAPAAGSSPQPPAPTHRGGHRDRGGDRGRRGRGVHTGKGDVPEKERFGNSNPKGLPWARASILRARVSFPPHLCVNTVCVCVCPRRVYELVVCLRSVCVRDRGVCVDMRRCVRESSVRGAKGEGRVQCHCVCERESFIQNPCRW